MFVVVSSVFLLCCTKRTVRWFLETYTFLVITSNLMWSVTQALTWSPSFSNLFSFIFIADSPLIHFRSSFVHFSFSLTSCLSFMKIIYFCDFQLLISSYTCGWFIRQNINVDYLSFVSRMPMPSGRDRTNNDINNGNDDILNMRDNNAYQKKERKRNLSK